MAESYRYVIPSLSLERVEESRYVGIFRDRYSDLWKDQDASTLLTYTPAFTVSLVLVGCGLRIELRKLLCLSCLWDRQVFSIYGPLTKITAHQRSLETQPPSTLDPPKGISLNHINFLYLFYYIILFTFFNFIATIVGLVGKCCYSRSFS